MCTLKVRTTMLENTLLLMFLSTAADIFHSIFNGLRNSRGEAIVWNVVLRKVCLNEYCKVQAVRYRKSKRDVDRRLVYEQGINKHIRRKGECPGECKKWLEV